jgi:hypothetical protein
VADGDPGREFTITTLIIGLPRQVVVQRCRRADVHLVLRDDGAVWPPLAVAQWRTGRATLAPGRPGRGGWRIGSAPGLPSAPFRDFVNTWAHTATYGDDCFVSCVWWTGGTQRQRGELSGRSLL